MKDLSENDSPVKVTCGNLDSDRARPGELYKQRRFFLNQIKADFSKEGLKRFIKKEVKCSSWFGKHWVKDS